MSEEIRNWICTTLDVEDGSRLTAGPTELLSLGVAAKDKLWAVNTELKVQFLSGTPALHSRTMNAARSWLVDGVKLRLRQVNKSEKSDIRISFDAGGGSWSYIGTDCKTIRLSDPTMNLGWATLETPDKDFSSVVIHEFGHALGLLHEHNHPDAKILWDKPAVYADLGGEPNNWDKDTIDSNVFAKFDAGQVIQTAFDQVSVMIYTVPPHWTTNNKSFMPSWKLSEGDAATIRKIYK